MDFTGKRLKGMVYVRPAWIRTTQLREAGAVAKRREGGCHCHHEGYGWRAVSVPAETYGARDLTATRPSSPLHGRDPARYCQAMEPSSR